MNKPSVLDEVRKNVAHAADILAFEAKNLRRVADECEGHSFEHGIKQRMVEMRALLERVQEELAVLRVLRTRM